MLLAHGVAAARRGTTKAAVVARGAHAVALATVVGPFFITNPDEMFSLDRFHPSALGYKRTAKAILPSVLVALGIAERACRSVTIHPSAGAQQRR